MTKSEGVQASPGSRERGAEVFARACAGCHGPNGAGIEHDGVVASAINVPAFLALISDQAIRRIIITGRPDLGMPNYAEHDGRPDDFQPLTSAEIDDLVALDRRLASDRQLDRSNSQPRNRANHGKLTHTLRSSERQRAARPPHVLAPADRRVRHRRRRRARACRWSAISSACGNAACSGSTSGRSPTFRSTKRGGSISTIRCAQPWDGVTALTGVYARYQGKNDKREDQFLVLSVNCAHLGCPVTWFQQSGLFMCPCHGGVYYADGAHASGPPPRGMFHVRVAGRRRPAQVQAPHYPTLQNTLTATA